MNSQDVMRPQEYSFWPNPENPVYGFLHCADRNGDRWTLRGDPALTKMVVESAKLGGSFEIGGDWEEREGWPDEWDMDTDTVIPFPNGGDAA